MTKGIIVHYLSILTTDHSELLEAASVTELSVNIPAAIEQHDARWIKTLIFICVIAWALGLCESVEQELIIRD